MTADIRMESVFKPENPDLHPVLHTFPVVLMRRISLTVKAFSNSPSFCIYLQSRPFALVGDSPFSYKLYVLLHTVALEGNIVCWSLFFRVNWLG